MKELAVTFSDWHVHNYKQFNEDNSRLDQCIRVLDYLGKFCTAANIKFILFGGDLYDQHAVLPTEVVNAVVEAMVDFDKQYPDITIIGISGNHDQSTKNLPHKPAVTALSHIESIVPDTFILLDNTCIEICEGVYIHGIPYYEYSKHFHEMLDKRVADVERLNSKQDDLVHHLMIHQTPDGIGNKMITTDTNPMDERYQVFTSVRCGHIHIRMDITEKFYLIGSPIHRDAADVGKQKGFYVDNLYNGKKVFKPLKGWPEYVISEAGKEVEQASNYVIVESDDVGQVRLVEDANIDKFNTNLNHTELLTNFWQQVDGTDRNLLKVGLSLLQK